MPRVNADSPEFVLTNKLVAEFKKTWLSQMKKSGVDEVLYTRLSVVALTQMAAIAGVDVGMSKEQFLAVSEANFVHAYDKAPKFG